MTSSFDFRDLTHPVLVAPMAGGPSTPELAAAGSAAGGLGFVPGGYLTAEVFGERLSAAQSRTTGPIGANLFVPQPSTGTPDALQAYARSLADDARQYGADLGEPRYNDDDFAAKIDAVLDLRPTVVSFTFGLPSADEVVRLRAAGIATVGTVTTLDEARQAVGRGVDALAVQGPAAGGHRGTFDPLAAPGTESLEDLLAAVVNDTGVTVPVAAAGGLMTSHDVAAVLAAGAVAAQLGTAFLLADEAGSSPVHREALQGGDFTETAVTKAFSGRYARGLRNRFVETHDAGAPLAYPEVHYMTGPLRAASVKAGDPQATNIWAGTGFQKVRTGSVADIIADLTDPV